MKGSKKLTINLASANFLAEQIVTKCNGCECFRLFLERDVDDKPSFAFYCISTTPVTCEGHKHILLNGENYPCNGN